MFVMCGGEELKDRIKQLPIELQDNITELVKMKGNLQLERFEPIRFYNDDDVVNLCTGFPSNK